MSDDEDAARKKLEKVMEALTGKPAEPPTPEQRRAWADLELLQKHRHAQGEVLAQAIELLAPELEASGIPLQRWLSGGGDPGPLEKLFGPAAARRIDDWRPLKAARLDGGLDPIGEDTPAANGPVVSDELYLLESGALVRITSVGTWHRLDDGGTGYTQAIVRAVELEPAEALRHFEWGMILLAMLSAARRGAPERLEQLRSLLSRAGAAVIASTEALEAVVRKG